MTLREIADQCAAPLEQLPAALNLPPDINPHSALKALISRGTLSAVTGVKAAVARLRAR
jgi:hypothetical protein